MQMLSICLEVGSHHTFSDQEIGEKDGDTRHFVILLLVYQSTFCRSLLLQSLVFNDAATSRIRTINAFELYRFFVILILINVTPPHSHSFRVLFTTMLLGRFLSTVYELFL